MDGNDSNPVRRVTIVPNGDLIIKITNYYPIFHAPKDAPQRKVNSITEFKVHRSTLINCPTETAERSNVFLVMLSGPFKEAKQKFISLEDDDTTAMTTFLRLIHEVDVDQTLATPHENMWSLVKLCDKYNVSTKIFEDWFAKWYDAKGDAVNQLPIREMLYPCWKFNYAPGFAEVTRRCAYELPGHVTESNPTNHYDLRLPQRVIQQLNAARGRLRTILHRGIFNGVKNLYCNAECGCKMQTEFLYNQALFRTGAWPLEDNWLRESPNHTFRKLSGFAYKFGGVCRWCSTANDESVKAAVKTVREYFNGLCLDCMDSSKPKADEDDEDYWDHKKIGLWDYGCRVKHAEPTWYFSYMGRRHKD